MKFKVVRDSQYSNAVSHMVRTPVPMVTVESMLLVLKAPYPISVTVLGITTDSMLL